MAASTPTADPAGPGATKPTTATGVQASRPASAPRAPAAKRQASTRAPAGLLLALVVACGYAAFARGATADPDEARLQVLLAALGLVAAGLWFGPVRLRIAAPRAALAAVALLAAFVAWTGISLAWSVAPEDSWLELNRWFAYALVLVLGLAVGSSTPRAVERLALAWLAAVMLVALYALATKAFPGIHVPGLFNLNQQAEFSRLRSPLDYWNALALWCVLGAPVALVLASDRTRSPRLRLTAATALTLLVVVGGLTYSRGGVLAFVVAVAFVTALAARKLPTLAITALSLLAAAPALAFAFASHTLTTDGAALHSREGAGAILAAIVLASVAALVYGARRLIALEARAPWPPRRSSLVWRSLRYAALGAVVLLVIALAVSHRGLSGSISHEVHSFTTAHRDPITDPARLLSTNSGNRWVWWKEAAGAFWSKPLGGWGAGSFPVTHLLLRRPPPLPVSQPHSVLLQLLAETGIVGALLAAAAIALLLRAVWLRLRATGPGRERELAIALLAACVAWVVHGFFDWDSDFPAVTLPVLLILGVLAARPGTRVAPGWTRIGSRLARWRPALLGLGSLLLCAFAVSAILPSWSRSISLGAVTAAGSATTDAQLAHEQARADLASRLDPLAVDPLLTGATIAIRRGRDVDARRFLEEAVGREPDDAAAWAFLARFAVGVGDLGAAERAAARALSLDPLNAGYATTLRDIAAAAAAPARSATATGTPLPAG